MIKNTPHIRDMQSRTIATILFVLLGQAASLFAQLSDSGSYFGKIGAQDFALTVDADTLSFYLVDRANARLDWGIGTLSANRQANFTTTSGRLVVISSVRSAVVNGTFGGAPFSVAMEKPTGTFDSIAYNFAGTIGTSSAVPTNSITSMLLFVKPSGRVLLLIPSSTGNSGGIGAVSEATGLVTVLMSNTQTWSFVPQVGLTGLTGNVTVRTASGALVETRPFILYQGFQPSLINISTRAVVSGSQNMIAGFVIQNGAKTVLIRAVGPTLATFGVQGANGDPSVTVFKGQTAIASNDNWGSSSNASEIASATTSVGAFALPAPSKDAVLFLRLEPRAYTAVVASPAGVTGEALIEVYEVGAH